MPKKPANSNDLHHQLREMAPAFQEVGERLRKAMEQYKGVELVRPSAGIVNIAPPRPRLPAESMHRRLLMQIKQFERTIDPDKEIGVQLVQSGTVTVIHIERVGFDGPDLVTFEGTEPDGSRVRIVKHFSQVDVTFKALPKLHEPARRIGFLP